MQAVIIERELSQPIDKTVIHGLDARYADCLRIYRAAPRLHFLGRDGRRIACVFAAPDAEALRTAMRDGGAPAVERLWAATFHTEIAGDDPLSLPRLAATEALAIVERSFAEPVRFDDVDAPERAGGDCMRLHRVRFLRSYFAFDQRRMLCLYAAPDAESVRIANAQLGLPVDRVWGAEPIPAVVPQDGAG